MADWGGIGSRGKVIDRRGFAPIAGGISLTGVALLLLVNYLTGGDIGDVVSQLETLPAETRQVQTTSEFEGEDSYELFASAVLGSANDWWTTAFGEVGETYVEPTLVLFRTGTNSACGVASSQVGPHYCPPDQTIYLDETFFDELTSRFGAQGGDVAEAYVIAHEVGHHVQNIRGTLNSLQQPGMSSDQRNGRSIAIELQADCYAGLWAYSIRDLNILGPGEIAEAMDAAAAVGDDRIQESVTGQVNPENWTHGSSQQRVAAFTRGYEGGTLSACNL